MDLKFSLALEFRLITLLDTEVEWVDLELDRLQIYPIVPIADCPDCENSRLWGRLWVLPIVKSGYLIMNTTISMLRKYAHRLLKW